MIQSELKFDLLKHLVSFKMIYFLLIHDAHLFDFGDFNIYVIYIHLLDMIIFCIALPHFKNI